MRASSVAAVLAMVSAVLGGCGGPPAPSPAATPSATVGASATPTLGAIAAALDSATSYRFSVVLEMLGPSTSPAASASAASAASALPGAAVPGAMSGVVVLRPVPARRLDWVTGSGGTATVTVIGGRCWIRSAAGVLTEVSAASADGAAAGAAVCAGSARPERLFAMALDEHADGLATVGRETVNGVATVHVRPTAAALSAVADAQGLGPDLTADAWLAVDGGYLVRGVAAGTAGTGGTGGTGAFRLRIDISGVDDPANQVLAPG